MCGRYVIARSTGDIAGELNATPGDSYQERIGYNVAPTTPVPIVLERADDDGEIHRELHTARWGLLPSWAKDDKLSYKTFNARSESVTEKPTFRSAVRSKRCAVPADAYYEWLKDGDQKRPHLIRPKDGSLISFAGLYEWWRDPKGPEDAPWLLSCTILTGPSSQPGAGGVLDDLSALHDRLPLPMSQSMTAKWLTPSKLDKEEAADLVQQVRDQATDVAASWELYEVDKAVGNVRNQGPELVKPGTAARVGDI